MHQSPPDPATDLAAFAAELTFARLPSTVVATLKRMLLDTLGTTLAGATLGLGCREVVATVRAAGGAPESTLLGSRVKVPAPLAALANGALAHALNYDDVYPGGGHLGVVTVPAALAIAERQGAVSGRTLLVALAAGAEIAARLGVAARRAEDESTEAKPQPTQMLGVFGAAAAAGRVAGLDPQRMLSALGLALMQANGNRQPVVEGTPAKAIYAGFPNFGGVLAAQLAAAGLNAACAAFEGTAGFFPTFYASRYDRTPLVDRVGDEWYLQGVGFKPWPTTGRAHACIEAALYLACTYDLRPEAIAHIEVRGGPYLRTFCEPTAVRLRPQSSVEAEDSVFFGVFKALVNRAVTLADFQPAGLRQPETLRLAERAGYTIDPALGHAGVVEVTMASGAHHHHRVDHPLGDPSHPLTDTDLVQKFLDCARHAPSPLDRRDLELLVDQIWDLEEVADVGRLPALIGGTAGHGPG